MSGSGRMFMPYGPSCYGMLLGHRYANLGFGGGCHTQLLQASDPNGPVERLMPQALNI